MNVHECSNMLALVMSKCQGVEARNKDEPIRRLPDWL